jgi:hypothetical protein
MVSRGPLASARVCRAGRRLVVAAILATAGAWPVCGLVRGVGRAGVAVAAEPAIDKTVQATWKGLPLRVWAERMREFAGRPVVIDRRIDPDVLVTLEARGEPLAGVLEKVARSAGAEVVSLRSSIRFVPAEVSVEACQRAERAREQALGRLPPGGWQVVARRAGWAWPEGARPRDLVSRAIDQAGVAAEGLDRVPHDHFPAATLPPMSLGERLDLVLAHFDLRIDWRAGDAGPVAAIVALDAGLPAQGPNPVSPPTETERPRPPGRKPPRDKAGQTTKTKQTFTLRAEAALEEILEAVAARLDVTLDLDRKALEARGIAPTEIVRVDVKDVSAQQVLAAILGPLGLEGRIVKERLEVRAPAAP